MIDLVARSPADVARHRLYELVADRRGLGEMVHVLVRPARPALGGALVRDLAQLDRTLAGLPSLLAQPVDAATWRALDNARRELDGACAVVLRLLGGLALCETARGVGLAQAWVDELRERAGVRALLVALPAMPSDAMRPGVVAVPFPGMDLWFLPQLAAAVAELIAAEPDVERDAASLVGDTGPGLRVVVADVIATALVGPAYPVAFTALDLDLGGPGERVDATSRRVGTMLQTLRCMDATVLSSVHQVGPYRPVIAHLEGLAAAVAGGFDVDNLYHEVVVPRLATALADTRDAWRWAAARCAGWDGGPDPGLRPPGILPVVNVLWSAKLCRPDADDLLERAATGLLEGVRHPVPRRDRPLTRDDVAALRLRRTERGWSEVLRGLTDAPVPGRVRAAVMGRFLRLLSEQLQHLADVRLDVEAGKRGVWAMLGTLEREGRPVRREALEFLGASLLMTGGGQAAGSTLVELADRLLARYAERTGVGWGARAIPAPVPMLDTATDIVRVRVPDPAGWSAILTMHEIGHLVARDTPRFAAWRADRRTRAPLATLTPVVANAWLEELFADVFATYAAGPTFACASLILHFVPVDADGPRGDHPPHALRVATILSTLRAMNDQERPTRNNTGPYGAVLTALDGTWAAALSSVRQLHRLSDPGWDELAAELFGLVRTDYRLGAAHRPDRWRAALRLAEQAEDEGRAGPRAPLRDVEVEDVLGALWVARLGTTTPLDALGRVSRRWIAQVLRESDDD